MTQTGTLKEDPTQCYFCKGIPTHVKQDAHVVERELPSGHVIEDGEEIELLPICEPCNEHWYDDTEKYPALLPLAILGG